MKNEDTSDVCEKILYFPPKLEKIDFPGFLVGEIGTSPLPDPRHENTLEYGDESIETA